MTKLWTPTKLIAHNTFKASKAISEFHPTQKHFQWTEVRAFTQKRFCSRLNGEIISKTIPRSFIIPHSIQRFPFYLTQNKKFSGQAREWRKNFWQPVFHLAKTSSTNKRSSVNYSRSYKYFSTHILPLLFVLTCNDMHNELWWGFLLLCFRVYRIRKLWFETRNLFFMHPRVRQGWEWKNEQFIIMKLISQNRKNIDCVLSSWYPKFKRFFRFHYGEKLLFWSAFSEDKKSNFMSDIWALIMSKRTQTASCRDNHEVNFEVSYSSVVLSAHIHHLCWAVKPKPIKSQEHISSRSFPSAHTCSLRSSFNKVL